MIASGRPSPTRPAGAPRALAIRGDPGVGKTRLLDAAVADPAVAGAFRIDPGRRPRGRERDPLRRAVAAARAAARRHRGPPPAPGRGPGGGAEPRPRGRATGSASRWRRWGCSRTPPRSGPCCSPSTTRTAWTSPRSRRWCSRCGGCAPSRSPCCSRPGRAPTPRPRWSAGSGPCRSCPSAGSTSGAARRLLGPSAPLSRATWEATAGNPLALLELPVAGASPLPVEPVRLSTRLVRAYERRLSGLPDATRRALLLVAVAGSADDAVAEALAEQGLDVGDLEPAEAADLLGRDDRDDRVARHRPALPPPADPQRGLPRRHAGPEARGAPGARGRARPPRRVPAPPSGGPSTSPRRPRARTRTWPRSSPPRPAARPPATTTSPRWRCSSARRG